MISELNNTPKSLRLHIGIFGEANTGKSTLVNTIFGHEVALVSETAGTTTDPVFKPMELHPIGPVVFIDTAGFDDKTALGEKRTEMTMKQLSLCDCAILTVKTGVSTYENVKKYAEILKSRKIPIIIVENIQDGKHVRFSLSDFKLPVISADCSNIGDIEKIKKTVAEALSKKADDISITGDLVKKGDKVLLVMPQDSAAPKGRLILPQVQVTRDLLDNKCTVISSTEDMLENSLVSLSEAPDLVITDSQVFKSVSQKIPKNIRLTSFSVLMAKSKADLNMLMEGAKVIDSLMDGDKVLIIEVCSHQTLDGDIAAVKIPALLQKYTGRKLNIVNLKGKFNETELNGAKLAIHCGACMITRRAMTVRQQEFSDRNIPMTNFGIAIAYMNGITDRIVY